MEWELLQSIHRIRPVRKEKIELVIISSFWPPILPPPDEVIDHSKDKNWKEKAISALEPFVREFGFLNQDIGFLANVYIGYKERVAIEFRQRATRLLDEYVAARSVARNMARSSTSEVKFSSSQLDAGRGSYHGGMAVYPEILTPLANKIEPHLTAQDSTLQIKDKGHTDHEMPKSNLDIYILYIYVCLREAQRFSEGVASVENGSYQISYDDPCITSNKQWADLLIDFKNKYPHFEEFEIKLPHAKGNPVKGIGIKKEVLNFYRDISQLGIIRPVNLQTYKTLGQATVSRVPLPYGILVFHLPEDLQGTLQVGFKDEVQSFFGETDGNEIQSFLHGRLKENSTIITNNGKDLVKVFRSLGIGIREIHDIILYERIIRNGEIHKDLTIEELFKQYELPEKPDSITFFSQMWQVWEAQKKIISELLLEKIVRLENRVLWVVADLEINGIGTDGYGMIEYQDKVREELGTLEAEISTGFPAGVNWKDEDELKRYMNTTFSLNLTGTGKECPSSITDPNARSLMESVLHFRSLEKTNTDIERYLALVGKDDRIHDSNDQLGTKTGRITLGLQTVRKDGPMRSFFRAAEGYKFVIADYSQFEVRVLTGLSRDEAALDIFKNGRDFFSEVASIGFNVGQNGKTYRNIVKPIVHGHHNGRGMYSIHDSLQKEGLNISLDAVEDFLTRYQLNFPQFFEWLDRSVKDAFQNGFAVTPLGRRLSVSSTTDPKSISNFPIQGTASDGFKLALIALDERLQGVDAKIVHILHDEIIVEAKDEIAEAVAEIMKECMEAAFKPIFPEVPFVVEPRVAEVWG
jgi:DNA polymerase I-like protein with 3'-5' exonuclease and polymerase domains